MFDHIDNDNVGAYVILRDGAIFEWKATRGWKATEGGASMRARFRGDIRVANFTSFDDAREWMRQWPIHPEQPGFAPYEVTP